jgi:L-2-hydroxyglutarate oxidase
MYDFAIIGGGIVGLATGAALGRRYPFARILLVEKEAGFAQHQTGRNSGVIHSGIYYKPGSLKAEMAQAGNQSLRAFCYEYGVPFEVCGKLIVATSPEEIPQLDVIFDRALKNGVPAMRLRPEEVKEVEPHVSCIAAIRVPTTGIVDYRHVCNALVHEIQQQGGELKVGTEVLQVVATPLGHLLETSWGSLETRFLINCAGLHSDRVARLGGLEPKAMIVPFRGEYFELKPERRHLVRNLIYPVPNPAFPFLGVHFTRAMDGSVHAGPNAVLSMKREGYHKSDFSWRDLSEVMTYPGFWRLSSRYYREGLQEMYRSWSKAAFTRSLQRLRPCCAMEPWSTTSCCWKARTLSMCVMLLRRQPRLRSRSRRGSSARCRARAGSRWSKWHDGARSGTLDVSDTFRSQPGPPIFHLITALPSCLPEICGSLWSQRYMEGKRRERIAL